VSSRTRFLTVWVFELQAERDEVSGAVLKGQVAQTWILVHLGHLRGGKRVKDL